MYPFLTQGDSAHRARIGKIKAGEAARQAINRLAGKGFLPLGKGDGVGQDIIDIRHAGGAEVVEVGDLGRGASGGQGAITVAGIEAGKFDQAVEVVGTGESGEVGIGKAFARKALHLGHDGEGAPPVADHLETAPVEFAQDGDNLPPCFLALPIGGMEAEAEPRVLANFGNQGWEDGEAGSPFLLLFEELRGFYLGRLDQGPQITEIFLSIAGTEGLFPEELRPWNLAPFDQQVGQ